MYEEKRRKGGGGGGAGVKERDGRGRGNMNNSFTVNMYLGPNKEFLSLWKRGLFAMKSEERMHILKYVCVCVYTPLYHASSNHRTTHFLRDPQTLTLTALPTS
jgi:hypothetical protein